MSVLLPGWLPVTRGPGRVCPGITGHYRDRLMRGIACLIPAIDRM